MLKDTPKDRKVPERAKLREVTHDELVARNHLPGPKFRMHGSLKDNAVFVCPECRKLYSIKRDEHAANEARGIEPMCQRCRETQEMQADKRTRTGRRYLKEWEKMGEDCPAPFNLAQAAARLVEFAETCEAGKWKPAAEHDPGLCGREVIAASILVDACHFALKTIANEVGFNPDDLRS